MPGIPLGIGETNPKLGAAQYDARRIDGLSLIINPSAGVSEVPVGTIVSIQEDTDTTRQYAVTGLAAIAADAYGSTMKIIGVGVLEIAAQSGINSIAPTPGSFKSGDLVAVVSGSNAVCMCPIDAGDAIDTSSLGIGNAYVTKAGKLAKSSAGNIALVAAVSKSVPSLQMAGQLKPQHAFVRFVVNAVAV